MLPFTLPSNFGFLDASIILAVSAALVFYLGKMITRNWTRRHTKSDIYFNGFMFLAVLGILPSVAAYVFISNLVLDLFDASQTLGVCIIISLMYTSVLAKLTERIKKENFWMRIAHKFKNFFILFTSSAILFAATFLTIRYGDYLMASVALLLSFFSYSSMAIIEGLAWKNSKQVNVTVKYGDTEITGILIKFEEDFLVIKNGKKITEIQLNSVREIQYNDKDY